jgi:hypothetical protein
MIQIFPYCPCLKTDSTGHTSKDTLKVKQARVETLPHNMGLCETPKHYLLGTRLPRSNGKPKAQPQRNQMDIPSKSSYRHFWWIAQLTMWPDSKGSICRLLALPCIAFSLAPCLQNFIHLIIPEQQSLFPPLRLSYPSGPLPCAPDEKCP